MSEVLGVFLGDHKRRESRTLTPGSPVKSMFSNHLLNCLPGNMISFGHAEGVGVGGGEGDDHTSPTLCANIYVPEEVRSGRWRRIPGRIDGSNSGHKK